MFTYKQAQLVIMYLKKQIGKELHGFLVHDPKDGEKGLDGDFWIGEVDDEEDEMHAKDSPMRAYEDVFLLDVTHKGFVFAIKIYSKKLEGFSIWISYDEDEGGAVGVDDDNVVGDNDPTKTTLHEKFADKTLTWDAGVRGYPRQMPAAAPCNPVLPLPERKIPH